MLAQVEADSVLTLMKVMGGVSVPGVLAVAILAFVKGWIVTGREFNRVLGERNDLLQMVRQSQAIAQASQQNTSAAVKVAGAAMEKAGSGNSP